MKDYMDELYSPNGPSITSMGRIYEIDKTTNETRAKPVHAPQSKVGSYSNIDVEYIDGVKRYYVTIRSSGERVLFGKWIGFGSYIASVQTGDMSAMHKLLGNPKWETYPKDNGEFTLSIDLKDPQQWIYIERL